MLPKRRNVPSKSTNRYTAGEVIALLEAAGGAVAWKDLVQMASADSPRAITQLRQMLNGLQRNGEIVRDHQGGYHLPQITPVVETLIVRQGRQLTAGGLPIDSPERLSLRVGDAVEMREINGQARIMRIISHADTPVTGILRHRGRHPYVEGIGSYRGRVTLLEAPKQVSQGDTVQVRIVDHDRNGLVGVIDAVIPHDGVLDQAIATALSSGQIPHIWPDEVTRAAAKLPGSVNPSGHATRVDLSQLPLVTIDGETAQDFDDAVFAEPLANSRGGHRLVVAIADVGHYVKSGAALDVEAVQRGTSVYFPERVVPMLPEAISNGLCSLRPQTPRLALVCDMKVSPKGEVTAYDFYEALIFSHARLTYNEVQAYLDDGKEMPVDAASMSAVTASINALRDVYEVLRAAREARGALDFETTEAILKIDKGRIVELQPVQRLLAHQLIEEAMIAANVSAASFLEANDTPALYRVHEIPDVDKIEELRQALATVGVRLPPGDSSPKALQKALASLPEHVDKGLYAQLALRTLKQAIYSPRNQGHYGLALERYMHFTSPIRRYPDLVVHRAIKSVLARRQKKKPVKTASMDELIRLGELCSTNERRAESAGWLVDAWLKCDYLLDQVGNTVDGVVAGVTEFGLFVELKSYFVQGLLHISNLGQDYFIFDSRHMALVGERNGKRFKLGDSLAVVIGDIDPPQGRIDLALATDRRGKSESHPKRHSKGKHSKDKHPKDKQAGEKPSKDKRSKDKRR